ncbi:MAG: cytochrome P450, partial [Myxococcota bacterium]
HAEIDTVLGDRKCTTDDLRSLDGIRATVSESNRLFPPAWAVSRENRTAFDLGGVTMPPDTQFVASPWVTHRDPRWWNDPLAFRPERWRNGETDGLPRFAYFPFGGGPRVCIGNHFATMEAQLLLATFLQRYRVTADEGFEPSFFAAVTVRPRNGVWVHVHRR